MKDFAFLVGFIVAAIGMGLAAMNKLPARTQRRIDRRLAVWLRRRRHPKATPPPPPPTVRVVVDHESPYRGGSLRIEQEPEEHPVIWGIAIAVVVALATYLVCIR